MDNDTHLTVEWNSTIDRSINPVLKYTFFFTCIWILVAHGLIILCFIIFRSKPWTSKHKQYLSLTVNDLLVGVACLNLLVNFRPEGKGNFSVCALSFYILFVATTANLHHALAICIGHTLIRKPTDANPQSVKATVILLSIVWTLSFCACAIPFILRGHPRQYVLTCNAEFLFEDLLDTATVIFAILKLVPLISTNCIYIIAILTVLVILKKISPTTASTSTSGDPSIDTPVDARAALIKHRKVIFSIGGLLFFLNVFTIPKIIILLALFSDDAYSRDVRVASMLMFILNSAVSPFVYAFRVKHIREHLIVLCRMN